MQSFHRKKERVDVLTERVDATYNALIVKYLEIIFSVFN